MSCVQGLQSGFVSIVLGCYSRPSFHVLKEGVQITNCYRVQENTQNLTVGVCTDQLNDMMVGRESLQDLDLPSLFAADLAPDHHLLVSKFITLYRDLMNVPGGTPAKKSSYDSSFSG
jgi:hypothetical protein